MTDEAAAQATTDEAAPATEPTALQQAAQSQPAVANQETNVATQATPVDKIPEKFRTMRDDGTVDLEASAAKMAESYSYLEKKLGSGEAPPKSHTDYAPVFSDDAPIAFDDIKDDPVLQSFMEGAHQVGLTNAQVSYVLDQYLKVLPSDIEARDELLANDCIGQLKETTWKDEATLKAGLADAYRAVSTVAGEDADYLMATYGNDPAFIRFAAQFGNGMREDSPPQAMQMIPAEQFTEASYALTQQLMDMPVNDPRRPALLARQAEMYAKQYGTDPAHGLG
jgi:hypothetical protein